MHLDRDQHIEALLRATVELVSTWSQVDTRARVAHEVGIELPETDVQALYLIGRAGHALRPSELAEALGATRPTTSKVIARLITAGLATRETGDRDRRSAKIVLTGTGTLAYQALDEVGYVRVREAVSGMSEDSVVSLTEVMQHLAQQFSVSSETAHRFSPQKPEQ